jgi:hypothetical protein
MLSQHGSTMRLAGTMQDDEISDYLWIIGTASHSNGSWPHCVYPKWCGVKRLCAVGRRVGDRVIMSHHGEWFATDAATPYQGQ